MTLDRKIAWDLLDAQEGTGPVPLLQGDEPARLLGRTRRIAMVGASPDPVRPSHGVMRQLLDAGYDVVPVNPTVESVLGRAAYATLEEAVAATGEFDMVDVFRRPEHTPEIARSAVAIGAKSLWLQLGVVNWEAAQIARDAGLDVVMDRCTAIEHRRLGFLRD
jgi:predicted CoA-binding protein